MSRREKPPKTNQVVLPRTGPEVMEQRLLLPVLQVIQYGCHLAGMLLQASPGNHTVIHWGASAGQGHAVSSLTSPRVASSAHNGCLTSFTPLSRQNSDKEGDGNSGSYSSVLDVLREKERSRSDSG